MKPAIDRLRAQLQEYRKLLSKIIDGGGVILKCTETKWCLSQDKSGYLDCDPRKMCNACEAYWHIDCARIVIETILKHAPVGHDES